MEGIWNNIPWRIENNYDLVINPEGMPVKYIYEERDDIGGPWDSYCDTIIRLIVRENIDTENMKRLTSVFSFLTKLEYADLRKLDTTHVTEASFLFSEDFNLKKVDLPEKRGCMDNIRGASGMFSNCFDLEEIDLRNFTPKGIEEIDYMFNYCQSLKEVDLTGLQFNTDTENTVACLFNECVLLETVKMFEGPVRASDFSYMFQGCKALKEADLSHIVPVTDGPINRKGMFSFCESLQRVKLPESQNFVEH